MPHTSPTNNRTRATLTASLALLALLSINGCVKDANTRITMGQHIQPTALEPAHISAHLDTPRITRGESSIKSLSRDNWKTTTITIPVDGAATFPSWRYLEPPRDRDHWETGQYPTAESSLAPRGASDFQYITEWFTAPAFAFAELVSMPVQLYLNPIWQTRYASDTSFQRDTKHDHPDHTP